MAKLKSLLLTSSLIYMAFGVCLIIKAQAESIQGVVAEVQSDSSKYVGSVSCRECHAGFYKLWSSSHHGLAMQPFTPEFAQKNLQPQKEGQKITLILEKISIELRF